MINTVHQAACQAYTALTVVPLAEKLEQSKKWKSSHALLVLNAFRV